MLDQVTIAKIGGESAGHVLDRFDRWNSRRVRDPSVIWSHEEWPDSVKDEVDCLTDRLARNRTERPVLFYTEWVDAWSMSDWIRFFPAGGKAICIPGKRVSSAVAYPLPDGGALAAHLNSWLRRKHIRERCPQEDRWFLQNLLEAVHAWEPMPKQSTIVVSSRAIGGSWQDEEVEASLASVPDWLTRGLGGREG